MKTYKGIAASPGYAVGPIHPVRQKTIVPVRRSVEVAQLAAEIDRFGSAVAQAKVEILGLIERLTAELGAEEAEILSAQLLMLEDEMVWDATLAVIRLERINAEAAFARTVGDLAARFLEMEDETFRERVNDLRDVEQRVLRAFQGEVADHLAGPPEPSIVSAVNLTPSDTAALGSHNVLGFIMDEGGNTSHVAILARSIGVPAIVGLRGAASRRPAGQTVAIDGTDGRVIARPDEATRAEFALLTRQQIVIKSLGPMLGELVGLSGGAVMPDGTVT